ncbi:hypothetical protein FQA39_LY17559 [Lamprigera yunnana]|nr:hypothetical protein FQA39_LY17559 [Lamprigera yunnana]
MSVKRTTEIIEEEPPPKRSKGIRNDATYKRNVIKKSKVKGIEHTNHKGVVVNSKSIGQSCKCPMKCFNKFADDEKLIIFNKLYQLESKYEHDLYLQGLIERTPVARKRVRSPGGNNKTTSLFHFATLNQQRVQVNSDTYGNFTGYLIKVAFDQVTEKEVFHWSFVRVSKTKKKFAYAKRGSSILLTWDIENWIVLIFVNVPDIIVKVNEVSKSTVVIVIVMERNAIQHGEIEWFKISNKRMKTEPKSSVVIVGITAVAVILFVCTVGAIIENGTCANNPVLIPNISKLELGNSAQTINCTLFLWCGSLLAYFIKRLYD